MSATNAEPPPAAPVRRGLRLCGQPRSVVAVLVAVEFLALAWCATALIVEPPSAKAFERLALLVALCIVSEEVSRRVGTLRLRIRSGPQPDMTSVWTFAAAITLPAGYAGLLAAFVGAYVWFRRLRSSGQYLYRRVYSASTVILACLSAGVVLSLAGDHLSALPSSARFAAVVIVALVVYTGVNRLLISLAVLISGGGRGVSTLLGSLEDNALELATLCLGGLTALAVVHEPWLSVLVLLPMVLLQRAALVKQLEQAASTDAKTGLLNAVAWQQVAQRELSRAQRDRTTAAVLLIDLDHFKAVNDTHGHLVGDEALRAIGRCLRQELRDFDTVGRFGGEEFVALLPNITVADAAAVADRVRARIASTRVCELLGAGSAASSGSSQTLSASVGIAGYPAHATELQALLHAADAALYTAKRAGRNRVEIAGSAASGPDVVTTEV